MVKARVGLRIRQVDSEHLRRRYEKRRNTKPRGVGEILRPLGTAQFHPVRTEQSREMPMRARSIRFRNRTLVVGRTAFVFDNEGVTTHEPRGNSIADFNALLKYPGMENLDPRRDPEDDPTVPLATMPVPPEALPTPGPQKPDKLCAECGTGMWGGPELPDLCPTCQDKKAEETQAAAPPIEEVLADIAKETGTRITQVDLPAVLDEEPESQAEPKPEESKVEAASELPAPVSNPKGRRRRSSKTQEG